MAAQNTLKSDASIRTATSLKIGQRSRDQAFEGASMQDLRVYARQLTSPEVLSLVTSLPLASLLKASEENQQTEHQPALLQYYLTNVDAEFSGLKLKVKQLEAEHADIEKRSPVTHVQQEKMDSAPMANVLMRGEYDRVGDQSSGNARLSAAAAEGTPRIGEAAQWIVDRENPLTARDSQSILDADL